MLDWLKNILGDNYTEDIDKKVSEEIGKGFVSRADFNTKNEELKTARGQLADANKTIDDFKGMDIDGIKRASEDWKQKYEKAEKDYAEKIAGMEFDSLLEKAVSAAKGRNAKAIRALLDVDALKESKNQEKDIKDALEALKTDSAYLFESEEQTPPPYAPGPGTNSQHTKYSPEDNAIRAAAGLKIE